jgi:class 3 adenylate cyclase/pimeloyl-ACP methyl ester carboxylesterase
VVAASVNALTEEVNEIVSDVAERRLAAILVTDMVGYSRLMERDESGTISRQKLHRAELIDPRIARFHGRIVKTTGDGLLVEFVSVVDAVKCAIAIQHAVRKHEADSPEVTRIQYRIGINLGDVVVEDDDIFGDGVNVAARLEGICEPGGVCISNVVHQSVENNIDAEFDDRGDQTVKNISRPVRVWQWRTGETSKVVAEESIGWGPQDQDVRFCTSPDGVQIAYAVVGSGPPLVKAPNWMSHLEYDWESPVWRHLMQALASDRTLVRFDQRGNGLSDRQVDDISFDTFVQDLETVVDAVGLDRFPLLGISQGCAISIAYAVRNPDRVSALVLYGGYSRGLQRRGSEAEVEKSEAYITMIRHGWGQDNPSFRQLFTSGFMPDATPDQMNWFNELQRVSATPEIASRIRSANDKLDVSDLLPQIQVPTLVLHARDDGIIPFDEGRRLASSIPNARFVALEGRNHVMLEDEPAWTRFVSEVRNFLNQLDEDSVANT